MDPFSSSPGLRRTLAEPTGRIWRLGTIEDLGVCGDCEVSASGQRAALLKPLVQVEASICRKLCYNRRLLSKEH
jgi:hypothetical protein